MRNLKFLLELILLPIYFVLTFMIFFIAGIKRAFDWAVRDCKEALNNSLKARRGIQRR